MTTNAGNYNAQDKYINGAINGMNIVVASNTTLTISAGTCIDSTNSTNITFDSALTLNAAVNGVNGLDTGSFAASTLYYIYALSSSVGAETPCTIMSLSASSPLLPVGFQYDSYKLIGFAISDGSTHFLTIYQTGNGNYRKYMFDAAIAVLSAGTATSLTTIGSLVAIIPAINNTGVLLNADFTPATANDKVSFFPGGSTATLGAHVTGSVAAKVNSGQAYVLSRLVSGAPVVLYINSASAGSSSAWVQGFDHFV